VSMRYEIWCDDEDGQPMQMGWSNNPESMKRAVKLHPCWSNHRAVDRLGAAAAKSESASGADGTRSCPAPGWVRLTLADPKEVPKEISVCPECGGRLWWQFTTTDWLRDLHLECENESVDFEEGEDDHRFWQSEWQPVIDKVRRWLGSGMSAPNAEICERRGKERGS
jgi:hypothetical protein